MPTPEQLNERPFVDVGQLPDPTREYVGWFDVVGTQSHLTQSHKRAVNFFAKIHMVALHVAHDPLRVYPVMDGVYVTSPTRGPMLNFIHAFYRLLAIIFCAEANNQHRFIVRGALAFGPVTHGSVIPTECASFGNDDYKRCLLIGIAMIQAYQSENQAPPLGLFLHESVRAFSPPGDSVLSGRWWRWWRDEDEPLVVELREAIPQFFTWAQLHPREFDYPVNRVNEHRSAALEYFGIAPTE
jgi:hypothetical protein